MRYEAEGLRVEMTSQGSPPPSVDGYLVDKFLSMLVIAPLWMAKCGSLKDLA
jgi:hypothetical protein